MGVNATSKTFLIVGANHRSAGVTLRDRMFVDDDAVPQFLNSLRHGAKSSKTEGLHHHQQTYDHAE